MNTYNSSDQSKQLRMRNIVTFTRLLEEALADSKQKSFTGSIKSFDQLGNPEALNKLDQSHSGIFAVVAYNPSNDDGIKAYIEKEYLIDDSTEEVLVLYCPTDIEGENKNKSNLVLDEEGNVSPRIPAHPSYSFIRDLFKEPKTPLLPGIVFLPRLGVKSEPVYVSLIQIDESQIRQSVSALMQLAAQSTKEMDSDEEFSEKFTLKLAMSEFKNNYIRGGNRSVPESVLKFWATLLKFRTDLIATIKIF